MEIVGALDIHRRQITFDVADVASGEVRRGRIEGADRDRFRAWIGRELPVGTGTEIDIGIEGCTGWRYVAEELAAAGVQVHLGDPAEMATLRGSKRRAKTDRRDCEHARRLLVRGDFPECAIAPGHVLEVRSWARLYKTLLDDRAAFQHRIHALLFHQGAPAVEDLCRREVRERIVGDGSPLTEPGRFYASSCYRLIDAANAEMDLVRGRLRDVARRQRGCRRIIAAHYGVGELTGPAIWAEFGDCRRFANATDAVRHTGLDITVYDSDGKRAPGRLSRQGPPVLRWALYESAICAARPSAPDHDYWTRKRRSRDPKIATLSVARKLARRIYHTLVAAGDDAIAPLET